MPSHTMTAWILAGLVTLAGCAPQAGESVEPSAKGGSGGGRASGGSGGSHAGSGGAGANGPAGSGGLTGGAGAGQSGGAGAAGSGGSAGTGGAATVEGGTGGASNGSGGTGGASEPGSGGPDVAAPTGDTAGIPPGAALPDVLPACVRSVPVADAAALTAAIAAVQPGDCLLLADGTYPGFMITAKASVDWPIVVRAANRGKAVITGGNVMMLGAAYVVVEGLSYTGMASAVAQDCERCRITRSRFLLGVARATGTSRGTRIDRNEFGPKNTGDGHYVHATGMSEFTQIDRNYLHDATGGGMSRDAASLGCCGPAFDYHDTGNVFEYNLMVRCSSDAEYISIKSSSNIVRYNTFRNNGGTLTLRAGRKNSIYGNYFFGGGGIRAYEDDHKIFNNYIETGTALAANGNGGGHAPLRRAIIVHNTFLGGVNIGGTGHTIANNIGAGGGMGNLSVAAAGLVRKGEVLEATASSGSIDKAVGSYPFVTEDMHGQPRDKPDIGADEWSTAPAGSLRRPLTPADVGPDAP